MNNEDQTSTTASSESAEDSRNSTEPTEDNQNSTELIEDNQDSTESTVDNQNSSNWEQSPNDIGDIISNDELADSEQGLEPNVDDGQQIEDEQISSLAYLQKYGASSNVSERQNAAKNIVKTLQNFENDDAAVQVIFSLINKTFGEDIDAVVRGELLEQLPIICMHCSQAPSLAPYIREVLYPLLVKFLNDPNTQVRKTCQAAILILVEQGLLAVDDIVELIYPELMKLSGSCFPDDVRVEAVCLLCKLVSTLGRERTIKLFLQRFSELCDDPLFHVRKTCASHLGELSRVLCQEITEKRLVPHLISLSQDSVWGVRKTCAECFTDISYNCAMQTRRHHLAPVFLVLLADSSRWVQCSAFQALGPFISTFADSSRTGLQWVQGELVYNHLPSNEDAGANIQSESAVQLSSPADYSVSKNEDDDSEQSTIAGDVDDDDNGRSIGLSSLLDGSGGSSSVITSNIAQLAKQRLNGDVNRAEMCIVDIGDSASSSSCSDGNPPASTLLQQTNRTTTNGGANAASATGGQQSNIETEFHSFKFWQSTYCDDVIDSDSIAANETPSSRMPDSEERFETKAEGAAVVESEKNASSEESPEPSMKEEEKEEGGADSTESTATVGGERNYDYYTWASYLKSVGSMENADEERTTIPQTADDSENKPTDSAGDREAEAEGEDADGRTIKPSDPYYERFIRLSYETSQQKQQDHYVSFPSQVHGSQSASPGGSPKEFEYQDIIPQALLDQFLSMVEPSRAQSIESDISRHCAFNLPAVAFTIGRRHWPLIKPTYLALANDMQWKVRRTLAFSIHELAAILGSDLIVQDLLPVFSGFLRDLDEVKIGILRHLYDFLKLLDKDVRRSLLPSLADFLQTDNYRSWRFRHLFAEQLILLCELFDIEAINEYLSPIAMTLAIDKVSEIRQVTYRLLATILFYFFKVESGRSETCDITDSFIQDIIKGFAKSQRWVRRQTFIYVCREVYRSYAVSKEKFASDLFPPLFDMIRDRIPNVRIALSSLFAFIYTTDVVPQERVAKVINLLTLDRDRDVRLNAITATLKEQSPGGVISCDQNVLFWPKYIPEYVD